MPAAPIALFFRSLCEKPAWRNCSRVNYFSAAMTSKTFDPSAAPPTSFTAFSGFQRVARGARTDVIAALRARSDAAACLVFDDHTGMQVDLDLRDGAHSPEAAAPGEPPRGVGRPKLGVVAREVTLLPRQWEWLARQPGGASVALRRLVDDARRVHAGRDAARAAREAAYGVMTGMAGNLPGFEEATRALFAGDRAGFEAHLAGWPDDLRSHLHELAGASWPQE
jgi:hypothetical protein